MVIDYGKLIYGNVDSSEYGIYVSGEGVYNAPQRAVEFVNVPGRNGAITIDQGRYENIKITYPAMALEEDQETFRERLSAFRNAILSQRGYQRLEDSYHPEEYRMGVYCEGLEVKDLLTYHQGGNFELVFECKPQRWLTVGDYPIPIDSGDVLDNPTPFESGPLLEVKGYGSVSFNEVPIATIANIVMGDVELTPRANYAADGNTLNQGISFDSALVNTGDTITIPPVVFSFIGHNQNGAEYTGVSYSIGSGDVTPTVTLPNYGSGVSGSALMGDITFPTITQVALAEGASSVTKTAQVTTTWTKSGGGSDTVTLTCSVVISHDQIILMLSATPSSGAVVPETYASLPPVTATSSVSIAGDPTYIDCGIGEAYKIEDGQMVSLNPWIDFGSELPALVPGSNKITFDNTITDLKIAPRWWRI